MLNAVWVAVIVALASWVAGVIAVVWLLAKAGRLISETSAAVASVRARQDELIDRAHAALDAAGEQLGRTDAITASMDEVTAAMAELTGKAAALAPLARMIAASAASPLGKVAALAYGVNRALRARRPGGGQERPAGRAARARMLARPSPDGGRRAALTSQREETAP